MQIRRNDQQRLQLAQHFGGGDRLGAAQFGERGVQLPLHPAARVEVGLPMPQHHQTTDPHCALAESSESKSTDTTGQSPHSRSRA